MNEVSCLSIARWLSAIPPPIIAAIISAVVSGAVALVIGFRMLRTQRRQHIENMINKLIDMSFQYPYLEDDSFCSKWNELDKTSTEAQRYESYCCFVFNLLETIWGFHAGKPSKIREMLYVDELVLRHWRWWKDDKANNSEGYDARFRNYIAQIANKGASQ